MDDNIENNMEENMEAYIGEPKLEEHVRCFPEIQNSNISKSMHVLPRTLALNVSKN